MSVIDRRSGLSQAEIGKILGMDRTSIMKLLDKLEQRGLLVRKHHHRDRRAYSVELTSHGRQWRESRMPDVLIQEEQFLATLTAGERVVLQEMLLRLIDHSLGPVRKRNPIRRQSPPASGCSEQAAPEFRQP